MPSVIQPIIRVHPETKRKALYLNPAVTRRIHGLTTEESEGILKFLFAHSVKPEFVYCHHWQIGDALLWDNGVTMHRREPFDPSARRLMKRTTIFLSRERHIVPEGSLAAAGRGHDQTQD